MSDQRQPGGVAAAGVVDADVAVVGAGPAGLAAAVTAAEGGLSVAVVDAGLQSGGQYWRHPDENAPRGPEDEAHDWETFAGCASGPRPAGEGGAGICPASGSGSSNAPPAVGRGFCCGSTGQSAPAADAGATRFRPPTCSCAPAVMTASFPFPGGSFPE
jgi:hypothetical protein